MNIKSPWPHGRTRLIGTIGGPFAGAQLILDVPPKLGLPRTLTWRLVDSEITYARIGKTQLFEFQDAKMNDPTQPQWWDNPGPT